MKERKLKEREAKARWFGVYKGEVHAGREQMNERKKKKKKKQLLSSTH